MHFPLSILTTIVGGLVGDFVGDVTGGGVGGGGVPGWHTPQVTGQKSLINLSGAEDSFAFKLHLLSSPSCSIQPWVQVFEPWYLKPGSFSHFPSSILTTLVGELVGDFVGDVTGGGTGGVPGWHTPHVMGQYSLRSLPSHSISHLSVPAPTQLHLLTDL